MILFILVGDEFKNWPERPGPWVQATRYFWPHSSYSSHSFSLVFFSILILFPSHSLQSFFSFFCFLIHSPYVLLHLFPFHNHAFLSAVIYPITFYRTFGLHLFSYSFPHISFIILPYHSSSIPIPSVLFACTHLSLRVASFYLLVLSHHFY